MFRKKSLAVLPLLSCVLILGCKNSNKFNDSKINDVHIITAGTPFSVALLGQGYDVKSEKFKGPCVQGDWTSAGSKSSSVNFERSMSKEEIANSLGFSIGGRGRYGMVTGEGNASFARAATESSYSEATVYSSSYRFQNRVLLNAKLTETGERASTSPAQWEKTCGNEYVEQVELGAKIFISAKIEFSSASRKSDFNSRFKVKGSAFSVAGELKTASAEFKESASISIRALQLGGDVSKLSSILSGLPGTSVEVREKNVQAVITCSMAAVDNCLKVLTNSLQYATDTTDPGAFPQQLTLGANPNSGYGPAEVGYITRPWSNLALDAGSMVVPDSVKAARKLMSARLEENLVIVERVAGMKTLRGRIASDQLSKLDAVEKKVADNLDKIGTTSETCYELLEKCAAAVSEMIPQLTHVSDDELRVKWAPLDPGLYLHKGSVFKSDGQNYCSYHSPEHFKFGAGKPWGEWTELPNDDGFKEVMGDGTSCPVVLPEGRFHHMGSVIYSNGTGHYCGFNSPSHYSLSTGSAWGDWIDLGIANIPFSGFMKNDGVCNVQIPEGAFHHKGSVFYSNGQGGYCYFTSPEHFERKSGVPWGSWKDYGNETIPFDQFMRNDGPC